MHQPMTTHYYVVLRYLKGAIHHGIHLRSHSPLVLHTFSYANWISNCYNHTSTNAYIVILRHNPISWSSKKLYIVAYLSTKAKYCSVASTIAELT